MKQYPNLNQMKETQRIKELYTGRFSTQSSNSNRELMCKDPEYIPDLNK